MSLDNVTQYIKPDPTSPDLSWVLIFQIQTRFEAPFYTIYSVRVRLDRILKNTPSIIILTLGLTPKI